MDIQHINRPELFEKSVNTIIEAYRKGELRATLPTHCACGFLCGNNSEWYRYMNYLERTEEAEAGKKQISESGYTLAEIKRIEKAFTRGVCSKGSAYPDYFTGAKMAVAELSKIHESESVVRVLPV